MGHLQSLIFKAVKISDTSTSPYDSRRLRHVVFKQRQHG